MTKKLKMLIHYYRECNYLKKIFKQYGKSLLPGKYKILPNMRAIVINKQNVLNKAQLYFPKREYSKHSIYIVKFLNFLHGFKNKSLAGSYEAIYTANNYDEIREVKLFSFKGKKILTICVSKHALEKQLALYQKWHKIFRIPEIQKSHIYENAFEIQMIDITKRSFDIQALKNIIRCCTLAYRIKQPNSKRININEIIHCKYDNPEINILLTKVIESVDPIILQQTYPLCFQHGDLSPDNLIYGVSNGITDYWWIDWEHARERIFFYDLFFYMLNVAVYFNNSVFLDSYFKGEHNDILEEYFANFCLEYFEDKNKDYFLIFALLFLKERVCEHGKVAALKMYIDFFEKYRLLKY